MAEHRLIGLYVHRLRPKLSQFCMKYKSCELKLKKSRKKGKYAHTEILIEKNWKDTLVWPSIDIEKLTICICIYFFASLTTKLWWCSGHVVCLWIGRSGFKSWLGNFFFYFSHLPFQILSTSFFCFLCLKIRFFVFTFKKLKTSY